MVAMYAIYDDVGDLVTCIYCDVPKDSAGATSDKAYAHALKCAGYADIACYAYCLKICT